MAEMGKGVTAGKLAINVQKKFTRAQEKVLQRLGKADETRDAAFEETVNNFNKQMVEGSKLQKDLKVYLTAVKTMHEASRRLQDCLADMYEPEWFGKEEIDSMAEEMIEKDMDNNLEEMDMTWIDYHEKITDDSLLSLDTYLSSFPDIKARIAKRERKMVDFDSARHHFASLQKGKKKDEAKIAKPTALLEMAAPSWAQGLISAHQVAQTNLSMNQAEEELGRAQKVFEELNVELQDELPALWDSRVGVYVNTFQNLAGNQEKFHKEMGKLSQNLNDVMAKLDEQRLANDGANHSVPPDSPATRPGPLPSCPQPRASPAPGQWQDEADACSDEAPVSPGADMASLTTAPEASSWDSWEQEQPSAAPDTQGCDDLYPQESHGDWEEHDGGDGGGVAAPQEWDCTESSEGLNHDGTSSVHASYVQPSWDDNKDDTQDGQGDWGEAGGIQNAVANGSGGELPPGFLYKVKALHDYAATDGDELELKTGDMVLVLAFDNPDEQDDGWLLGVHQSHWLQNRDISVKGVFPENFTQKL